MDFLRPKSKFKTANLNETSRQWRTRTLTAFMPVGHGYNFHSLRVPIAADENILGNP
jgi:hypothetical protein